MSEMPSRKVKISIPASYSSAAESHQMETERSPIYLTNIGLNRCPAETLMRCIPMAAIKSIEPTLKLNEINRFLKPNLLDASDQIINFPFIDHTLMRAVNGFNRNGYSLFHDEAVGENEAIGSAITAEIEQKQTSC